jgi:glyoxylase-like metal-dependent hydrolase (beta-lactamase superfamily II)
MAGPVVHTYRAAESGLDVNSYLVEGESGVVVVDTNLLVSDIEALRARLRALKKLLLAILVTHAHPDHFNGVLGLVRDKEVPVYATAGVGRVIEEIADAKRAQWSPVYGAEWPAETYYPNSLLADGAQVQLNELTFTAREMGPAESHADSYLVLTADGSATTAFTGDLAFHGTHPYTADGHSGAWLAALDVLGSELAGIGTFIPGTVTRPGRGCSPTSGVTCSTTASSSDGYPGGNRSCPRRRSPSSAPPCKRSSRTRR